MQKLKKGYKVNLDKIEEGYIYCEHFCVAENASKAKMELLKNFAGILKHSGGDVNYLNMPVVRYPELDEVLFEGIVISRRGLEEVLAKRKRVEKLNSFLLDDSIKYMYIMKRGMYYRPNSCGYTDYVSMAGVYKKEEVVADAMGCDELFLKPIDVNAHNEIILDAMEDLKTRLIV